MICWRELQKDGADLYILQMQRVRNVILVTIHYRCITAFYDIVTIFVKAVLKVLMRRRPQAWSDESRHNLGKQNNT